MYTSESDSRLVQVCTICRQTAQIGVLHCGCNQARRRLNVSLTLGNQPRISAETLCNAVVVVMEHANSAWISPEVEARHHTRLKPFLQLQPKAEHVNEGGRRDESGSLGAALFIYSSGP